MKFHLIKLLIVVICILVIFTNLFSQDRNTAGIEFQGNKDVSAGRLKKAIQTQSPTWKRFIPFLEKAKPFDERTLLNDLLRIEKFYHQEGYLQAKVTNYELSLNNKRDRVKILIIIEEGQATKVNNTTFQSLNETTLPIPPDRLQKLVKLKAGKRYREEDLKSDYHKLIENHANRGYPYIKAQVKPIIDKKTNLVELEWFLDVGPLSNFGQIEITGNNSVSDNVVLRGLGFKQGQTFEQNKLANAQSQVYRLELFQFVSLRAMTQEARREDIPIKVRVKESKLKTLKFGAGFGTEESFRATAQWRHRNFLGGGRIFRAFARHSTNLLPVQLQLELSQPYFLSNRNDLLIKPFFTWQDERSFEAKRIGVETILNRQLTRRTNVFVATRIERDTVVVKLQNSEMSEELADLYNKSIIRIGISRNSADQLFTPTRGSISRLIIEEAGRFLRTRFKYVKLYAEYRKYVSVKPGYIFAWRVFVGSMKPVRGSNVTPVEESFFAGGSYSVRGWRRQLLGPLELSSSPDDSMAREIAVPIGGNSIIEGSFELRNPIYKSLSGAIFLDYGNVWKNWNGFDLLNLKFAIGTGIRFNTFIGPLRADFAWKLNKQKLDKGRFEFHISLGQAF